MWESGKKKVVCVWGGVREDQAKQSMPVSSR